MSAPIPVPDVAAICPYLGLVDDPASHLAYASDAQRCHAGKRPVRVDSVKQATDCLTGRHVTCSRYRPLVSTPGRPNGLAVAVADVTVDRSQKGRRKASERSRTGLSARRAASMLIVAIAVFGMAAAGLLVGTGLATRWSDGSSPTAQPAAAADRGSPTAGLASTAPATPLPTPSPTPTPTQTGTSASPSAPPTRSAPPSAASTPRVYVVRRGDTLLSIARQQGISVAALKAANVIDDPNLILVGQKLVIPAS